MRIHARTSVPCHPFFSPHNHAVMDSLYDVLAHRACVKAHKMALLAQRAFWRGLLRDNLMLNDILIRFKSMEAAEQVALSVYKRVLERYPQASTVVFL